MKLLIAFAMMLPLMFPFGTRSSGSNPKPEGHARSYEYVYSGTMMYPITFYDVRRDEAGAVRITFLEDRGTDICVIPGPADFFERVEAIVAEYRLHRLKNSYTPRARILDGHMWHAYIRFERNSISSGGSNAWPPEKLRAGINAINAYVQSLIDASSDADIVSRQDYQEYRRNK